MKIKTYEKVPVETLHVAGVNANLAGWFEKYCRDTKSPKSFYVNQMLSEFMKSTEKLDRPKAAKKAAAA